MDTITMIVGGSLVLLLSLFVLRLTYVIAVNLINGRKFHQALLQEMERLRFSNMLQALGINKDAFVYQAQASDVQRLMTNCSDCGNTATCDEKLAEDSISVDDIAFCNNENELKEMVAKNLHIDVEPTTAEKN